MAEERICTTNRKTVERMYTVFLIENDIDHTDNIFNEFIIDDFDEVCPSSGMISYEEGKVKCDAHVDEGELPEEDSFGEEVFWL